MRIPANLQHDVLLAPLTTLGLGGCARYFLVARAVPELQSAIEWARHRGILWSIVGGGSNLVVADGGFEGLAIQLAMRGMQLDRAGNAVSAKAAAGEPWDAFVAQMVDEDLAGVECLSGIPGLVGATPIQNVGAYGQEVSETIAGVDVFDPLRGEVRTLRGDQCGFAYRDSRFKWAPEGLIVTSVTYALRQGGAAAVRYAELKAQLATYDRSSLHTVRAEVIRLRKRKSMVFDPADVNHRSAGSFFTNPILPVDRADDVAQRAIARGDVAGAEEVPRFPVDAQHVKLAAGWLIERAGIEKGLKKGAVGVSTKHALALVHHGGGTTAELIELAREIQHKVYEVHGVVLTPEPSFLGFAEPPLRRPWFS